MSNDNEKIKEGFLHEEAFREKYNTEYKQLWPESYLEECSEEDREMYSDVEILTGRTPRGTFNKFCNNGYNRGKTYSTVNKRLLNSFKRFLDDKIERGQEIEFWQSIWDNAMDGDSALVKILLDRALGKLKDEVEIKTDAEISFTVDPTKLIDVKEKDETS